MIFKLLLNIYKPILLAGAWMTFSPLGGFWLTLLNTVIVYGTLASAILYWVK